MRALFPYICTRHLRHYLRRSVLRQDGLFYGSGTKLLQIQLTGVVSVVLYTAVALFILLKFWTTLWVYAFPKTRFPAWIFPERQPEQFLRRFLTGAGTILPGLPRPWPW